MKKTGQIMMKMNNLLFFVFVIIFAIVFGCDNNSVTRTDESPTRGIIKIAVDESYKLLLDSEIYTFQSLYPDAKINPVYTTESNTLELLLKDSVRAIVSALKLTEKQEKDLNTKQIIPRTTEIAKDAIAFIVNKNNPDSLLSYSKLTGILNGTVNTWKQIHSKSKLEKLTVVFDNNNSGNSRYLSQKFKLKNSFPEYCYAVKSNLEVINYVEKNIGAIGIISVNWISDSDDKQTQQFLKKVKVLAVSSESDPEGDDGFYRPYQGFIANGNYPFIRKVYMISRETFSGLASGFISFVAGDQGQRIILKSGLIPATMPVRLIQTKKL